MRVDDERRTTHSRIAGRVVLAATAAVTAWLFVPKNVINEVALNGGGQESNPAVSDQMSREIGQLEIGDQKLSIKKYIESPVENDSTKTEVFIYGETKKDPRKVMNDDSWKLVIGSKEGQFPTTMDVYPPAVESGVSADDSGFSYHIVVKAQLPRGIQSYSLELMHDLGDGASRSQSVPIKQPDLTPQKRT